MDAVLFFASNKSVNKKKSVNEKCQDNKSVNRKISVNKVRNVFQKMPPLRGGLLFKKKGGYAVLYFSKNAPLHGAIAENNRTLRKRSV